MYLLIHCFNPVVADIALKFTFHNVSINSKAFSTDFDVCKMIYIP